MHRKEIQLREDQVNEQGQIIDEKILKKDRLKFGICTILDRSEGSSLGGIPMILIRSLGGDSFHIGMYYALQNLTSFSQFVGPLILQRTKSNQKAMIISMFVGAVIAGLVALSIFTAAYFPIGSIALWSYLILWGAFSAVSGIQGNIESAWVGDLVPRNKLGWFNGYKWILTSLGIMVFGLIIGTVADRWPTHNTYAFMYVAFGVSFLWAAYIFWTATNRTPKNVTFIKGEKGTDERMNYTHGPMWCYILFFWGWSGSRAALIAFAPLYLIDVFKFSMTNIAWLSNLQLITGMILLYFLGKISDRIGSRVPLIVISGIVAICGSLWVSSAWWGVVPIIIYQVVNGAAGNAHGMVSTNLALEIFPQRGRASYIAFSRLCIGAVTMVVPALTGILLTVCKDVKFQVGETILNNYHMLFTICMLISISSIIPLFVLGRITKKQQTNIESQLVVADASCNRSS